MKKVLASLFLTFSLAGASCGSTTKSKKPVFVESEPTEQTVSPEEESVETPSDETATGETIDLGLEGSATDGPVQISSGDQTSSENTIGGCEKTDEKCIRGLIEEKLKEAKSRCGKDEACLQKAAIEEAEKMGITIEDGKVVVDAP